MIGQSYFRPLAPQLEPHEHLALVMFAPHSEDAFRELTADHRGRIAWDRARAEGHMPPLYEFAWNHTTLQALKVDPTVTYLRVEPILFIRRAKHGVSISWSPDIPGFRLEQADDLLLPIWTPLPAGTNTPFFVPVDTRQRYFRLQQP